jgi:protoporphyrinogen oxidase/putative flippase GtrA
MSLMIQEFRKRRTVILYGVIGVSAVVVDLGLFLVLYNIFGITPVLATVFSVSAAMVYAFTLNAVYNFKTKDYIRQRFVSYALVSLAGMVASVLIIKLLVHFSVDPNLAKMLSLPPIVILQYLINKTITFRIIKIVGRSTMPQTTAGLEPVPAATAKSIAVIGGGFTGLTAAYTLAKLGHRVTVYEAQPILGGLVAGFELDGLPLEKAYHFLYKTDRDIIGLADEIGVGHKLHFYPSSVSLYYDGTLYPFMTPKDLLLFRPLSFVNRIRAGVVALYLSKATKWKKFAKVSAYEWMLKWGGAQVTKVIWEPVLRGKFFNYYDKIAMSYLWSRVYVRANSKDKGDVTEKLGYFDGGFQTFTNRLVERCRELGVQFFVNTKPSRLVQGEYSASVFINNQERVFDACLTTAPSYVFRSLIEHDAHVVSQTYLERLTAVEYLGAVLLVFTSDTKLTDYYWHNVNDLDQPFLVLLSLDALVGAENVQGKYVYYVGAYVPHDHEYFSMTDDALLERWVGGIKALFPTFTPEMITNHRIFRFKNAQHIVEPGYEEKIVPYQSELSNLYLANFTQIFPDDRGTNYAVSEGIKVAKEIHDRLTRANGNRPSTSAE